MKEIRREVVTQRATLSEMRQRIGGRVISSCCGSEGEGAERGCSGLPGQVSELWKSLEATRGQMDKLSGELSTTKLGLANLGGHWDADVQLLSGLVEAERHERQERVSDIVERFNALREDLEEVRKCTPPRSHVPGSEAKQVEEAALPAAQDSPAPPQPAEAPASALALLPPPRDGLQSPGLRQSLAGRCSSHRGSQLGATHEERAAKACSEQSEATTSTLASTAYVSLPPTPSKDDAAAPTLPTLDGSPQLHGPYRSLCGLTELIKAKALDKDGGARRDLSPSKVFPRSSRDSCSRIPAKPACPSRNPSFKEDERQHSKSPYRPHEGRQDEGPSPRPLLQQPSHQTTQMVLSQNNASKTRVSFNNRAKPSPASYPSPSPPRLLRLAMLSTDL